MVKISEIVDECIVWIYKCPKRVTGLSQAGAVCVHNRCGHNIQAKMPTQEGGFQ